jgi:hypothetical protein
MADFNLIAVAQAGRLGYEAVLLATSLRANSPGFRGRLMIAEPQPGPLWPGDPRIHDPAIRTYLQELGAEIVPFASQQFGAAYPYGNKIEALAAMPAEPFLFLDTDTLILGELADVGFDFARPSASMRREGTWPRIELYGPGYAGIWGALYRRFGLDFASSLDQSQPEEYWERYLYFNAGWFYGADARGFGLQFLDIACAIRDDPPEELVLQSLDPWLDQVALPLVIHGLGGGRPGPELAGLDGEVTCHYRNLPLFYARESDRAVAAMEEIARKNRVKKLIRPYEPFRRFLYQGKGAEARALFDRDDLPAQEKPIRNRLNAAGLWMR